MTHTCPNCGATMAEGSQYCMQCGTPAGAPRPGAPVPSIDFTQPALIAGAALGLLSSIPLVNLGNCLCCAWVIGGGALAVWLAERDNPGRRVSYGDGAFAGVLAGAFGAFITTAFSVPIRLITSESLREQQQIIEEMLAEYPEIEGAARELILRLVSPDISFVTVLATFFVNLVMFSLFAMVGGILYVAVTGKK